MRTALRLPAQRVASLAAAISAALAATHAAQAQQLEEIIVTAERRELNLQDTPISVMNFDGETLELRGIDDMFELATIAPNLDIKGSRGTGNTSPTFEIRGIIGGGIPWTLTKAKGSVRTNGHLRIKVDGLVLATTLSNPVPSFGATVSCLNTAGETVNVATATTFPATWVWPVRAGATPPSRPI